MAIHPKDALQSGERVVPILPVCEHYAGNERFILKALEHQRSAPFAFDVTMDLEDGAPVGEERRHAEMVADLLCQLPADHPGRVGVRIHDIRHPHFFEDVRAIVRGVGDKLSYVVLPKAKNRGDVEFMSGLLQEIAKDTGREAMWPLHVLIESQRALADVFSIAAHPDIETLDFGSMDFISDHGGAIPSACLRAPDQFEHALMRRAKTELVSAALLYGVVPVHNVTSDVKDPNAAFRDAHRARQEFGFLRMWSIHPGQVEPITRGMSPDHREAERCALILKQAQEADWGPIRFEDELHDRASYRLAWSALQRSRLAAIQLPTWVEDRFFPPTG
ncbi:MAG: HpcH/HpaI aldolase/citrate lyase family protein [Myxococcota bacterium]